MFCTLSVAICTISLDLLHIVPQFEEVCWLLDIVAETLSEDVLACSVCVRHGHDLKKDTCLCFHSEFVPQF